MQARIVNGRSFSWRQESEHGGNCGEFAVATIWLIFYGLSSAAVATQLLSSSLLALAGS